MDKFTLVMFIVWVVMIIFIEFFYLYHGYPILQERKEQMKDFDWWTFIYYLILMLAIVAYFIAIPWLSNYYPQKGVQNDTKMVKYNSN